MRKHSHQVNFRSNKLQPKQLAKSHNILSKITYNQLIYINLYNGILIIKTSVIELQRVLEYNRYKITKTRQEHKHQILNIVLKLTTVRYTAFF